MTNEEIQNISFEEIQNMSFQIDAIKNNIMEIQADILNIKHDLDNIRNTIPLREIAELLNRKYEIFTTINRVYNIEDQLKESIVLVRRINGKEA